MIHEDDRRILEDWPEAKFITAKQDCTVGNHYHKIKTEKFIVISGNVTMIISTVIGDVEKKMKVGKMYVIDPGVKHSFRMVKDSVLLGVCSHPYDPTDDYR